MRHGFTTILCVAVCAVLAGARSYAAIAEWAADLPPAVRLRLGIGRDRPPSESTIRRCLQRVDHDQLDRVVSGWLTGRARATGPPGHRVVAVDGKSARGARTGDDRPVHLLAAFDAASGVVLGQCTVDGKTNEINAFAPLLDCCGADLGQVLGERPRRASTQRSLFPFRSERGCSGELGRGDVVVSRSVTAYAVSVRHRPQ